MPWIHSRIFSEFWREMKQIFNTLYEKKSFCATILSSVAMIKAMQRFGSLSDFSTADLHVTGMDTTQHGGRNGQGDNKQTQAQNRKTNKRGSHHADKKNGLGNNSSSTSSLDEVANFLMSTQIIRKNDITALNLSGLYVKMSPKKMQDEIKQFKVNVRKLVKNDKVPNTKLREHINRTIIMQQKEMENIIQEINDTASQAHRRPLIPDSIGRSSETGLAGKSFEFGKADSWREEKKNLKVLAFSSISDLKKLNKIKVPKDIYKEIVRKHHTLIHRLQSRFAGIKLKTGTCRGASKGRICNRDLPKVIASKGRFTKPFQYPKNKTGANLLLVIDESGSMNGAPIRSAREATIILSEALNNTRINFGVVGFSALRDREVIVEKVYKTLHEPLKPEKLGCIGIARKYIMNRDGSSFKGIAEHHLLTSETKNAFMIIISDGCPSHGGTNYVDAVGIQKTKKAAYDLRSKGIKLFALSIDISGSNYLQTIYGKDGYMLIEKNKDIATKLIYFISKIVKSLH